MNYHAICKPAHAARKRLMLAGLVMGMLAVLAGTAVARPKVEAFSGIPFGVARVSAPIAAPDRLAPSTVPFLIHDAEHRTFYPAFSAGLLQRLLGGLLGGERGNESEAQAWFLFTGDKPFRLTFHTPEPVEVLVEPRDKPRDHERLLKQWWREYNAMARAQETQGDFTPVVETYLTSMLARRLELPPLAAAAPTSDPLQETLELLMGAESRQVSYIRQMFAGTRKVEAATLPLPPELKLVPPPLPDLEQVAVEPLAQHVPEECFYVRLGSFGHYLWLQRLVEQYGGDLGRMITLRGIDPQLSQRIQQQLSVQESELAKLLGDKVIADMAILGHDLYLADGAAVGVIFQARSSLLLKRDLDGKRNATLAAEKERGAKLETVKLAGREVCFLSTPDNRVRSFYAVDGDFHLITTSRHLVERFFAAGEGAGSLAASEEFKFARTEMPLSRSDTVFVYLSAAFQRNLLSPQYQIERERRLQARVEEELLELALLAAGNEGRREVTLRELANKGYLPIGFGDRADGSRLELTGNTMRDSLRGARGYYLPIPDVAITGITPTEQARLAARSQHYEENWRHFDPLMLAVGRYQAAEKGESLDGLEHFVIDARVAPFVSGKYGWVTSMFGPPTRSRVPPLPGDAIHLCVHTQGGLFDPTVPPHHLFLGVQDATPLASLQGGGLLNTLRVLRSVPGYLGAWPKTGFIDRLPGRLGGSPPDAHGFSKLPFGLWRRQLAEFSVLAFDLDLLARVTPHLRVEPTLTPGQCWLWIDDLSRSSHAGWVNALAYVRARQASEGNARLMATLAQQFHVEPVLAKDTAEKLLQAKLVCPLGGEYGVKTARGGHEYYVSNRWTTPGEADGYELPLEFRSPLVEWFRGVDLQVALLDDRLQLHADLDLYLPDEQLPSVALPLFDLFGNGKKKTEDKPKTPPTEELPSPPPKTREF